MNSHQTASATPPETPQTSEPGVVARGTILKVFGVILICLGGLDSLLAWHGKLGANPFFMALLFGGALIYAVGAIRQGRAPK